MDVPTQQKRIFLSSLHPIQVLNGSDDIAHTGEGGSSLLVH
jgi:hypothetical protein